MDGYNSFEGGFPYYSRLDIHNLGTPRLAVELRARHNIASSIRYLGTASAGTKGTTLFER